MRDFFQGATYEFVWSIELAFLLLFLFGFRFLIHRWIFVRQNMPGKVKSWHQWFHYAAITPMRTLAWVLFGLLLIDISSRHFQPTTPFNLVPLHKIALISCLLWSVLRWISIFQKNVLLKEPLATRKGFSHTLAKLFSAFVVFAFILVALQVFGLDITPLVTFGGIGIGALALATKDIVANFYGGFMIQLSGSFAVGDQVSLPHKNILGWIEEIGWYFTTIRDTEKKPIYLPNALFSTEYLVNFSRMTHRCIDETLAIRTEDISKIESLAKQIQQYLTAHPQIDANEQTSAFISELKPYAIHLNIRAYTKTTDLQQFLQLKHTLLIHIYTLIQQAGVRSTLTIMDLLAERLATSNATV